MSDKNAIGWLRYEVEMRFTQTGKAVAHFDVYDTEHGDYQNKQRVVVWEELAETCARELCAYARVFAQGYIKVRAWEGNDGEQHSISELIAKRVWELDSTPEEMSRAREIKFEEVTKIEP